MKGLVADRGRHGRWSATLVAFIAALFLFPFSLSLQAQPIDLCNTPGGIVLEAAVWWSATIHVPANTTIKVTLLQECQPERDVESSNGVFLTGQSGWQAAMTWKSGPQNIPDQTGMTESYGVDEDMEILIELDACDGTKVRIECT